ncbi:LPS export ABC transporter periplasmic protein LptC, partial [Francisella tularensis]|uniref:LPS export ABC transporter periplasmic protein LptC n=1 Tax=Francisella tularensis TaxID=263 RepID=UPI001C0F1D36
KRQDSTTDKIYIKSSEMFYNSSSKDFYNNRFTKMYDPKTGNNTTGTGVKGNSETKIIELSQNVRSYYATS